MTWVVFHGVCVCTPHLLYLCIGGHLGCFYILAIINIAALNIGVEISFWITVFVFFWKIPRNGPAELYGGSIFKKICILFKKNLGGGPHQEVYGILVSPTRDWTCIPCIRRAESQPLDCQWKLPQICIIISYPICKGPKLIPSCMAIHKPFPLENC